MRSQSFKPDRTIHNVKETRVTVIIPTMLKNADVFVHMLQTLANNILELKRNQRAHITLVLIVNECTNRKLEYINNLLTSLSSAFDDRMIIRALKNLGYAPSIYLGYTLTRDKTDFYVIMNDDVVLPLIDTLLRLLRRMQENPKILAISPKIRNLDEKTRLDYAGAKGFFADMLLIPFARGRLNDILLYDHNDKNHLDCDVFMPSGAFFVARNTSESIPDPSLFITAEEIDIGIKALCTGYVICFDNSSYVFHKGSATIGGLFKSIRFYYLFRNRLMLLLKYASLRYLMLVLPLMFLHDLILALCLSIIYERRMIIAFVIAWMEVFKRLSSIYRKRSRRYIGCYDKLVKKGKLLKPPVMMYYILLRLKYRRLWKKRSRLLLPKSPKKI